MMISGKRAVVCGYEDASEGCAIALKQAGAHVVVCEVDPNHAVQARLRGFPVVGTLDDVVSEADIFVTTSIVNKGNMDPTLDLNNSNLSAGLEQSSGMNHFFVNPQTDRWVIPETNSSIIVLRNIGYPNLMKSWSATSYVVAMLDIWSKRGTGKYKEKIYILPDYLQEKVCDLHLPKLKATNKETKGEADHVLFVPIEEQGNVFTTSNQPKKSNKKILIMGVQACSLFGVIAMGLSEASKVKMELSFCAIWG